ncbi:MAG TPA: DciA family protein [Pyrinomonadaceae bacterium]|nr:DciA family protein [Pyrinomonadaceae bacterium]
MRANSSMDNLIKSLPGVLRAAAGSPEVAQAAAFAAFIHCAGEGLRSHAVPRTLSDEGTLVIAVADPLWQKQLHSMVPQLIFRTNTLLGTAIVKHIVFQVDPVAVNANRKAIVKTEEIKDSDIPLELRSAANAIHDRELRLAFLKTAVTSIKRQEKK